MHPHLTDGQLIVRPFQEADLDAFLQAVRESVESLSFWFPWCHPDYSASDAQSWIAFCQRCWAEDLQRGTQFPLGIFALDNSTVLGGSGINQINRAHAIGNLGYWVRESRRRQGVAVAASRLTLRWAFEQLALSRIEIVALPENLASQSVARRLGAHDEGILRNRLVHDKEPKDAAAFSLIRSDLPS